MIRTIRFALPLLVACGGTKISSDLPTDDTGDGGTADGGTADGGTADGGTQDGGADGGGADGGGADGGGATETDDDGDGWSLEDGDCNDGDETVHPGAADACYDDVDSNCNGSNDFDCDEDGYDAESYGGDDCDDDNEAVNPGAGDGSPDAVDNDCDDLVDEDVCNAFAPLGSSAGTLIYDTLFYDKASYSEEVKFVGWNPGSGTATVQRTLTGGTAGSVEIDEDWACDADGTVTVSGWTARSSGFDLAVASFSVPAIRALPEDQMLPGASWSMTYLATDIATGDPMWDMDALVSAAGVETVETAAGSFESLVVEVDYTMLDYTGNFGDRSGMATWYMVPGIGVVYSLDLLDDGSLSEERELTGYAGFVALEL